MILAAMKMFWIWGRNGRVDQKEGRREKETRTLEKRVV